MLTLFAPAKEEALISSLYRGTADVIGQEPARRQLAVLLERQIRIAKENRWEKSENALIFGYTGTGKTYLTKKICQLSGLPFTDANATTFTESGYAGQDLSQMFLPLLESTAQFLDEQDEEYSGLPMLSKRVRTDETSVLKREDLDRIVEVAETGVILLDELDKWAHRINHHTGRLDTAIQSEFLKIAEGSKVYVTDSEDEAGVLFDTSRVLIICAGAFVGLAKQVLKRMERDDSFVSSDNFWQLIEQADFVRYGLIPELAGRLSKAIFLRPLRKEHLAQIIQLPNGPIEELKERFAELNCEWDVPEEAVVQLADIALKKEVGARGLDSVLWSVFNEALFKAALAEGRNKVSLRPNQNRAELVGA